MLPFFAKPIAEARANGRRPAHLVIVSDGEHGLHQRFRDNPVVRIEPTHRPAAYQWQFLAGLEVEVATVGPWQRAAAICAEILKVRPEYLRVWWLDTDQLIRVRWLGITRIVPENHWVCADANH